MSCATKTPIISVSISRKARHIFRHARLDRGPAGEDADRHQEQGEHDQHQRDAVDAERPGERTGELHMLDELPLRPADLVIGPEQDPEREVDQRRDQRDPARRRGARRTGTGCPRRSAPPAAATGSGNRARSSRHRPGRGRGDAEQHHQRIGVEIAGLQPRGEPGAADDQRGDPVGPEAVDRALVALLPEQPAEPDRRAGRRAGRRARRNTIC